MGFFAKRLKVLREQSGLSQAGLAKEADLGLSTVCQIEQGLREPTFETLVKLAKGLRVSLMDFDTPALKSFRDKVARD